MKEFRLTEEEIKLVEKWSGKKLSIKPSPKHKKYNLKRTKEDKNLTIYKLQSR